MAKFEEILDFPPVPELGVDGKLNPNKASAGEIRGQQLFFDKARCSECHAAPYYTDNLMHNLQAEAPTDQWNQGLGGWSYQDVPTSRSQRFAALPSRRAPAHAGRYRRVLQSHHGSAAHHKGKGRLSRFLTGVVGNAFRELANWLMLRGGHRVVSISVAAAAISKSLVLPPPMPPFLRQGRSRPECGDPR